MVFFTTAVLKPLRLVHEKKGCNSNAQCCTREAEGARVAEEFTEQTEYIDKIVHVNRVAKVVKGGRRFSFSALVVVGNRAGRVGIGLGKANEVPEAIRKAIDKAKKNLQTIALAGTTIPHSVVGHYGAGRVMLRPAARGAQYALSWKLSVWVMCLRNHSAQITPTTL